jgi:hypothetical protein
MIADDKDRVVQLRDVVEALRQRADGIDSWLGEIGSLCKSEQKHCDEGTVERVYWHYGYAVAVKDVLDLLLSRSQAIS